MKIYLQLLSRFTQKRNNDQILKVFCVIQKLEIFRWIIYQKSNLKKAERSSNRIGCFKIICLGAVLIIKQTVKSNLEHSPNAESGGDHRKLKMSLLG